MSARPAVVVKNLLKDKWVAVDVESPAQEDHHWIATRPTSGRKAPPTSAGTVRSSRVQSAKTVSSCVSVSGSTTSSAATRTTIFSPRRTDDPIYHKGPLHPSCSCERCCKLVAAQCGFRLLPPYLGTFGPPPAVDTSKPVYPVDPSVAHKKPRKVLPADVVAAQQELQEFEAHLHMRTSGMPSMTEIIADIPPPPAVGIRRKTAAFADGFGEVKSPRSMRTPTSWGQTSHTATASASTPKKPTGAAPPGRPQRHAWIINALREEGTLRRESSFVRTNNLLVAERGRRDRRVSSLSGGLLSASALPAANPGGSSRPGGNGGIGRSDVVPGVSQIGKIQLASNFVVALVIKHTVSSLVLEYKQFVERHRPNGMYSGTSPPSNNTPTSKIQFVVHHQAGLTLPQFALFLEETVSREMTNKVDDALMSEEQVKAAFYVLADAVTQRLCASDLFATVALSIVPANVQVNVEFFVNIFDKHLSGFVPRTVFHHELVRKYMDRYVDPGMLPAWQALHEILKRLLLTSQTTFVYLLNEVISAPMTPMARTRLNVDTTFHPDDPSGVFSTHGDSRPLAITVREALCVVYAVEELYIFFQCNSLDRSKNV